MDYLYRRLLIALPVFLSGACAPLQQAPLVYSSKVAIGVDVSTNSTESPGISIILGVKTVDVAYVPVAVSKEADPKSPNGSTSTPGIEHIYAKYGQGSTAGDAQQLTEDNKRKINVYIDARSAVADATAMQAGEDRQVEDLRKRQTAIALAAKTIESLPAPPQPAALAAMSAASAADATAAFVATRDDAILKTLNPQLKAIPGDPSFIPVPTGTVDLSSVKSSLQSAIGTTASLLDSHVKAAANAAIDVAAKKTKADDLFRQAAQAASLLETTKTDAMSVFGRFDSDGTATAPLGGASSASAGLLVGKVFSTGLASQNLTEAAKISAVAACISNALVSAGAASAASASDRAAMVTAVSAACAPTPR